MSPKDTAQLLDKLTIKVVLLISSLLLAVAFSAQFMYEFTGIREFFSKTGLSVPLVSLIPLAIYCLSSAAYYLAVTFLVPAAIDRAKAVISYRCKRALSRSHAALEKVNIHPDIPKPFKGMTPKLVSRLEKVINKWEKRADDYAKSAQKIRGDIEAWYAQNAQLYIVLIALRFIIVVSVILSVQALPRYQSIITFIIVVAALHYPLFKALGLLLKAAIGFLTKYLKVAITSGQIIAIARMIILTVEDKRAPIYLKAISAFTVHTKRRAGSAAKAAGQKAD